MDGEGGVLTSSPVSFLISRTFLVMKPLRTLLQFFSAAPFFLDYLTIAHVFFPFFFFLFCRSQMGNLLKLLTCTELEQGPNFFLDFESELSLCLSSFQLHLLLSLFHIPLDSFSPSIFSPKSKVSLL